MNRTSLMSPTDRLAKMIERSYTPSFFSPFFGGEEPSTRAWVPPVDIHETTDALVLTADVPGLSKDDINITVENNVLTLSGERRIEKETKEENWHRIERSYGSFSRSFSLPSNIDQEKIDAAFNQGVLTITVKKPEEAKPRKIAIH